MKLQNKKIQGLLTVKNVPKHKKDFENINYMLCIQRIKLLCVGVFVFSFYFLYADLVVFKKVNDIIFKTTLEYIHLFSVMFSVLFLLLYKRFTERYKSTNLSKFIVRGYIFIGLSIAALSSVNSQRLTGNIDAYVIIVLIISVLFPVEPLFMFFSLFINHTFFMFGISLLITDPYTLISKQINASAMALAAFLVSYSLYRNRFIDFINEQKLCESESNFRKLFSVNPLPLIISSYTDGKIIIANKKACEFYGYSKEQFQQIYAKELYTNENDRILVLEKLNSSSRIENLIVEQNSAYGHKRWVIANSEIIEYLEEKCILTSVTDITELKRMENELLDHASTDVLTGVLNRRIGIQMIKNKLNSTLEKAKTLVLCFIDIDGLKKVNDIYGHNEGDYLINTICDVIKNKINDEDIFFRLGGDEFIILFHEKNEKEVEKVWEEIRDEYTKINNKKYKPYSISASHGLLEFNSDTNLTVEQIIELADQKMYLEKNKYKN